MREIFSKLLGVQFTYVLVVILVSSVGFVRSFLFMKWFDNTELGVISLIQTIILFLSLLQLGFINGGYRLFALDKPEEQRNVNNVIFSYFGVVAVIVSLFWVTLWLSGTTIIIENSMMLVGLAAGLFTLISNWLTNTLIGKRLIREINIVNFISTGASLLALSLVWIWGIMGAVISLIIQPLLFITITLFKQRNLRPNAWNFDIKLIRYILSFGFIPFLAGIFVMVNLQIERWSIANILGVGALGEFYLVFLFATLFVLIPTSLLNLFFPKAIYAYENYKMIQFNATIKKHLLIISIYLGCVVLVTIFGMQYFVDLLLPKHTANTIYVYYYLPGLVALVLCDPFAIILNSCVRLKPLLYAGVASVIFNIVAIYTINNLDIFTLTNMAIVKAVINIITLIIYSVYVYVNRMAIFRLQLVDK